LWLILQRLLGQHVDGSLYAVVALFGEISHYDWSLVGT
jgi:hypothetical protein